MVFKAPPPPGASAHLRGKWGRGGSLNMAFLPASSGTTTCSAMPARSAGMALQLGCLGSGRWPPGALQGGCLLLPPPLGSRPAWTLLQGRDVRGRKGDKGWLTDGKAPRCSRLALGRRERQPSGRCPLSAFHCHCSCLQALASCFYLPSR